MPNNYFQFKQFTIFQDQTAMKVGTDGVILGAWTSVPQQGHILDIGTGTGLIALMLAQRTSSHAYIDAIEIEKNAALQARENIHKSPWKNKIGIQHIAYQDFTSKQKDKQYELIITNPPYFENALRSNQKNRTLARHAEGLNMTTLLQGVSYQLKPQGIFSIIMPADNKGIITNKAFFMGLYPHRICGVKTLASRPHKRVLIEFKKEKNKQIQEEELIVKKDDNHYTEQYKALLKAFYLNF